jgi:hypothetical protein
MASPENKLRDMLGRIEELLSLANEGLLKAKRYGDDKEQIESELVELGKELDERDQLRIEKVIPKWRSPYKFDIFLPPNEVNQISPLRGVLFQLLAKYHSPQVIPQPRDEKVITPGKPHDGIKYLRSILSQAQESIFVKDNYLRPTILDVISEFCLENDQLNVRLLVAHNKQTPAFRASYQAFKNQYGGNLEARILGEDRDHPRYILIDEQKLFTPDNSLDQWGINTVNIHEHKDAKEIEDVKGLLDRQWSASITL